MQLPIRDECTETSQSSLENVTSTESTLAVSSDTETPATSETPSETGSTQPTTPSSVFPVQQANAIKTQQPYNHTRTITKAAVPIIPVTPKASANSTLNQKALEPADTTKAVQQNAIAMVKTDGSRNVTRTEQSSSTTDELCDNSQESAFSQPRAPPKSWADLFGRDASQKSEVDVTSNLNGSSANGVGIPKSGSLGQVLQSFSVLNESKLSFLEPRGLVNTGNLCYMNSVSQLVNLILFLAFADCDMNRSYRC